MKSSSYARIGTLMVVVGCSLAVAGGCKHHKSSMSTGAFIDAHGQLENRRQNAEQIADRATRNESLRGVALDAASQGVGDVAISATGEIDDPAQRDKTAEQCAEMLDGKGERAAAEKLADSISDPTAKDRVKSYLARTAGASK